MRGRETLRILFAGTPNIALPSIRALHIQENVSICAVLTNPDAYVGRKRLLRSSPVKEWAVQYKIPVLQPAQINTEVHQEVRAMMPELLVCVAYGKIFSPQFLSLFGFGGINMHPSLLPKYRGASPIQAAILAGDTETGVTIQYLAEKMDAGSIICQQVVPLEDRATSALMYDTLGNIGAQLLKKAVCMIETDTVDAVRQNENHVITCKRVVKEDGRIQWDMSAVHIDRMVRAYMPWAWCLVYVERCIPSAHRSSSVYLARKSKQSHPGAVIGVDNRYGILIQTNDGVLAVCRLKLQSRRELDFKSFLHGNPSIVGSVLR